MAPPRRVSWTWWAAPSRTAPRRGGSAGRRCGRNATRPGGGWGDGDGVKWGYLDFFGLADFLG